MAPYKKGNSQMKEKETTGPVTRKRGRVEPDKKEEIKKTSSHKKAKVQSNKSAKKIEKAVDEENTVEYLDISIKDTTVKRKRGRPAKLVKDTKKEDNSDPAVAKRGRGRPRKITEAAK